VGAAQGAHPTPSKARLYGYNVANRLIRRFDQTCSEHLPGEIGLEQDLAKPAFRCLAATLLGLLACLGAAHAQEPEEPFGVWKNRKNSVHIKTHSCHGGRLCGTVIWASEKAQADARKGGTAQLIGSELLRDFRRDARGRWKGKVLVPDIGMVFSGKITMVDRNTMTGRGCLLWGIGCKSQTWTRVEPPSS
jgi:uncharacterized protein (DUF2147 family)